MSLIIFFTSWILCLLPLLAPFLQLSRIYLHRHVNRKHQTSTAVKQKATRQHSTAVKPVLCIRIPIGSIFIILWNRIHISSGIRIHTGKKYHKSEAKGVRLKKKKFNIARLNWQAMSFNMSSKLTTLPLNPVLRIRIRMDPELGKFKAGFGSGINHSGSATLPEPLNPDTNWAKILDPDSKSRYLDP